MREILTANEGGAFRDKSGPIVVIVLDYSGGLNGFANQDSFWCLLSHWVLWISGISRLALLVISFGIHRSLVVLMALQHRTRSGACSAIGFYGFLVFPSLRAW